MSDCTTGAIIDGLGVVLDLDDGDLVASAVVIAKIVKDDGGTALSMAVSDGCSWLEQLGIVTAAAQIVNEPPRREDD